MNETIILKDVWASNFEGVFKGTDTIFDLKTSKAIEEKGKLS